MFKRHLWPAIQWICASILQIWCYLTRPFQRRSYSTELPFASPVIPSTPSFIQSQEPNFTFDAMRIFQLHDGPSRESHLTRNKLAVQRMRNALPNINRVASLSSTDPSPGFSLLTDVVENLVTPAEPDSPSLYSSPPSSPSSSLLTPCIVVSSPMDDAVRVPSNDERLFLHCGPRPSPQISDSDSISQGVFPHWPRYIPPEINGLAKRRNFNGAPIITNISRDLLPVSTTRLSQGNVTPTDLRRQQSLGRPRSALSVVTDFVRASTTMQSRNVSRETLVVSPESQAAFTQSSPFSAQAESFFIDDHLSGPPEIDLHDLGIYTDAASTLNLQVIRRKRTASEPLRPSFYGTTNNYEKPILAKGHGPSCRGTSSSTNDTSHKRARTLSGVSALTDADISPASDCLSPASPVASSILSHVSEVQSILSTRECESDNQERRIPPVVEADEEPNFPSRVSLYASAIFPFSLEDSVSWDTSSDVQHRGINSDNLNCNVPRRFDREEPSLGSVKLDDNVVDSVGVLECDPLRPTSSLSISDHRCGNRLSPLDSDAIPVSLKETIFLHKSPSPSPAIDDPLGGGSTTSSLDIQADSFLRVRNSVGLREEQSGTTCDSRETPLRQVGILDGLFVSGDSSVLPHISESTFCVGGSQTFSSLMSVASVDCIATKGDSVTVNTRRARRIGFYGPLLPPLVTPDPQDSRLSDSGIRLNRSASERQRSPSRHASRHVSALRPLVLPMRVAIRELSSSSAGDRSFEKAPDLLLQSNRNSIGFPPPYPIPEPPSYKSSTSTVVASGFPGPEEVNAFQEVETIPSLGLSTDSAPESEASSLDPDGNESTPTINWGIAF